jgi:dihydroorotate dehydrogenase
MSIFVGMYGLAKPFLFMMQPETAHHFAFSNLKWFFRLPFVKGYFRSRYRMDHPLLKKQVAGLSFPNPVGLAAGFDKDAKLFGELGEMGFGFVEIGTVTPKAQPGNDKPRLFRLVKDAALINRMGFNNEGAEAAARRLRKRNPGLIIGGNIGKNKVTPNEEAVNDYISCFETLFDVVDYFVVNVSSPNTPNLRALQDKGPLKEILHRLQELNRQKKQAKPMFLKIAPDLTDSQLDDICEIVEETGIDGVIATNTTISREGLLTDQQAVEAIGMGGLSGKPLTARSTEVIKYLADKSGKSFVIIGVGGIHSAADAIEKIRAGADLIQLYTGFIYEGPKLIREINQAIIAQA